MADYEGNGLAAFNDARSRGWSGSVTLADLERLSAGNPIAHGIAAVWPDAPPSRMDQAYQTSIDRWKQLGKEAFFAPANSLKAFMDEPTFSNALGVMPMGGLKMVRQGAPKMLEPDWARSASPRSEQMHSIHNDAGELVGEARLTTAHPPEGDVWVDWIGRQGKLLPNGDVNTLGPSEIRSLLGEIGRLYPEANRVGGWRTTGARPTSQETWVNIPRRAGAPGAGAYGDTTQPIANEFDGRF